MHESIHQLAAIMFTDIVGYTLLMGKDEQKAMQVLRKNRKIHQSIIKKYHGKWLKEMGDGTLASFKTVSDAVYCAGEIQEASKEINIQLRIGIHQGEVIEENGDIFGDGVNIASRLEPLAESGQILVSGPVHRNIKNKTGISSTFIHEVDLKNVDDPVKVYQISVELTKVDFEEDKRITWLNKKSALWVVGIAVVFLIGYTLSDYLQFENNGASTEVIKSIAVLPFSNNKPDPETDYLGFPLANEIIGKLVYFKNLSVRPSGSIRKYAGQTFDLVEVGNDLKVDYIIFGTYLKGTNFIRLNIELVDVRINEIVWRKNIEVDYRNSFELLVTVADQVIKGLNVQFTQKELNRTRKDIPGDSLAYEYYLLSISYPLSNAGNKRAIEMLKKSIELDSSFAPAYVQLGSRIQRLAQFGLEDPDKRNAESYFQKALTLNNELLMALGSLAMLYAETNRIEKAMELTKQMHEINPRNPSVHFYRSYIYRYAGMLDESIQEAENAISSDPKNPRLSRLGLTFLNVGEYEKAVDVFDIDKGSVYSLLWQGNILIRQDRKEEAIAYNNRIISLEPDPLWILVAKVHNAFIQGNIEDGLDAMRELDEGNIVDGEAVYYWASYYGLLGDKEGCIRNLRRAVDSGFFNYPFMLKDSFLDFLRDDPDFQEILLDAKEKHLAFGNKFIEKQYVD